MSRAARGPAATKRSGAALLEAVVAIALIAMIGLVGIDVARTAVRLTETMEDTEHSILAAAELVEAVSLWTRAELDQRLGVREQGPWRLEIQRLTPDLYQVALLDSTATVTILETSLLRTRLDADRR